MNSVFLFFFFFFSFLKLKKIIIIVYKYTSRFMGALHFLWHKCGTGKSRNVCRLSFFFFLSYVRALRYLYRPCICMIWNNVINYLSKKRKKRSTWTEFVSFLLTLDLLKEVWLFSLVCFLFFFFPFLHHWSYMKTHRCENYSLYFKAWVVFFLSYRIAFTASLGL